VPDTSFATPDLTPFCRLDELGLTVVGPKLEPDRAVLACRVAEDPTDLDRWCRHCGSEGRPRDTVTRELAHEPLGRRPTTLLVTIRRYKCTGCGRSGVRTPAALPSRAPSCPWLPCDGLCSGWSASTLPSPASPRHWRCPGTPPTTPPGPRAARPDRRPRPASMASQSSASTSTCGATPAAATSSSPSLSVSPRSATRQVPRGCWTWSRAAPSRRSRPGSPSGRRLGARVSRLSPWTGSPASSPPPPESSPPRWR
jgi:hypothetical protein